jgi:hypothetical protein
MRLSLTVLVAALATGAAMAQAPAVSPRPQVGAGSRPGLSPYLNLIRGGNTAANYYLGTRPEIQRRNDSITLRNTLNEIDQQRQGNPVPAATTGTVVSFNNTQSFFGQSAPFYGSNPTQQQRRPGFSGNTQPVPPQR